jgi:hypothetical protein
VNLQEEFRPIEGYEGLYEIGSFGTVVSLRRYGIPGRYILKKVKTKSGYVRVKLCRSGKCKSVEIHRLVAKAFIPNPNGFNQVNHKDGDKINNRMDNLEWCTGQQNSKHAYDNNLGGTKNRTLLQLGNMNKYKMYLLVILINDLGSLYIFKSIKEASRFINKSRTALIDSILNKYNLRGYKIYGYKRKDLEQFANGEPLPEVLKGIPWESYLNDNQSCNDYPSEGE